MGIKIPSEHEINLMKRLEEKDALIKNLRVSLLRSQRQVEALKRVIKYNDQKAARLLRENDASKAEL